MEKHRCKLCFRNFANGRAFGGHMRSHMMNLYGSSTKAKQELKEEREENINGHRQIISEEIESVLPSSSSSDEEENIEDKGLFSYGLRSTEINPKKKIGMVDPPEFCFGVEAAADSVVLQDRESETESSKNPICRRSKRARKSRISDALQFSGYSNDMKEAQVMKKHKSEKQGKIPSESPFLEAEPVSSISDTTTEEDVAYCLMMLSRDKWMRGENIEEEEEEDVYEDEEEADDHEEQEKKTKKYTKKKYFHDFGVVKVTKSRTRGKYRCETCNKVFRSYQALGGHRASHKRIKAQQISNSTEEPSATASASAAGVETGDANAVISFVVEEKIHECPFCYRIFSSGQALGGHKRSHVMGAAAAAAAQHVSISPSAAKPFSRFGETFIDLNLPAPVDNDDDDDISQIELSAVSEAEFVNPFKQ